MSPATTSPIATFLEEQRLLVDAELERLLPAAADYPHSIHQAMRHSVFAGGKRLRPTLCLEGGRLFSGGESSLLRIGAALELIHTYSLIHDDLPALDNDDLRRGQPTCHKVFGEATAILAGDALLTLAFETLADGETSPQRRLQLIRELAHAIGTLNGMVGGQVADLESERGGAGATLVDYIHSAKTGAFIRAAVRAGALDAGASVADLNQISNYGAKIGLAFQIADDILDVTGSSAELGKSAGKDDQQQKATYPAVHGLEESRRIAARLVAEACDALAPFGGRAERLRQIAHFLIERTH